MALSLLYDKDAFKDGRINQIDILNYLKSTYYAMKSSSSTITMMS